MVKIALSLFLVSLGLVEPCPYLGYQVGGDAPHEDAAEHAHVRKLQRGPRPNRPDRPDRPPRDDTGPFTGSPADAIADAQRLIRDIVRDDPLMGPKFVRLTFHDCVGGCDGCVDLADSGNFGLDEPMAELEPLEARFVQQLTRADIWSLAGIEAANFMQRRESVPYEFNYYGRATCNDRTGGPTIAMPSAHLTIDGVLDFFADEFDFNERESVAIMGAHTL